MRCVQALSPVPATDAHFKNKKDQFACLAQTGLFLQEMGVDCRNLF